MRVLITGVAGSGKTTAINELRARGHNVIDLDDCGVCAWVNKRTGEKADYVEGAGKEWIESHRWQVLVPKLMDLLTTFPPEQDVIVGGKVAKNQVKEMIEIFDAVYLLQPDDAVIEDRLSKRTSNASNFGKKKEERDTIIANRHEFERVCIVEGAVPLTNHGNVQELVDLIL